MKNLNSVLATLIFVIGFLALSTPSLAYKQTRRTFLVEHEESLALPLFGGLGSTWAYTQAKAKNIAENEVIQKCLMEALPGSCYILQSYGSTSPLIGPVTLLTIAGTKTKWKAIAVGTVEVR